MERRIFDINKKIGIIRGEKPKYANILFWKSNEWDEKNCEEILLFWEMNRYKRKILKYAEEIEKRLDPCFFGLENYPREKAKYLKDLDKQEKEVNEVLEGYRKRGLIGDFEASGNVKKIIKDYLNKEKFEGRAEVKPLLEQIREREWGAPVNRWLLGKI